MKKIIFILIFSKLAFSSQDQSTFDFRVQKIQESDEALFIELTNELDAYEQKTKNLSGYRSWPLDPKLKIVNNKYLGLVAKQNNIDELKKLLEENYFNYESLPDALIGADEKIVILIVKFLDTKNVIPNIFSEQWEELAKLVLKYYDSCKLDGSNYLDYKAHVNMQKSIINDNIQVLKLLIKCCIDINALYSGDSTLKFHYANALCIAAEYGSPTAAAALISQGINSGIKFSNTANDYSSGAAEVIINNKTALERATDIHNYREQYSKDHSQSNQKSHKKLIAQFARKKEDYSKTIFLISKWHPPLAEFNKLLASNELVSSEVDPFLIKDLSNLVAQYVGVPKNLSLFQYFIHKYRKDLLPDYYKLIEEYGLEDCINPTIKTF